MLSYCVHRKGEQILCRKNKTVFLLLSMAILLVVIVFSVFVYRKCNQECYKRAVFPLEILFLRDKEEYFVIGKYQDWGDGGYYYVSNGKRIPVYVIGNSPCYELAPPLSSEEANNKFLIKGYIDEALSETAGKAVLYAEQWEIIAPIHRSYDLEDPNQKLIRPLWYLDKYDVETGLVQQVVKDVRALQRFEVNHIRENCDVDSCIVTSEYCDENIQWYIVGEEDELTPVTLKGIDFEKIFGRKILSDCENYFLLCGQYDKSKNCFFIEEWDIIAPICWKENFTDGFNYYSEYYFTEEDVAQGNYKRQ